MTPADLRALADRCDKAKKWGDWPEDSELIPALRSAADRMEKLEALVMDAQDIIAHRTVGDVEWHKRAKEILGG